ncbi:MAG: ester cyclase [Burkholderiales bacterium]|nr:ester cyclase [Burkholderiales bacterium]
MTPEAIRDLLAAHVEAENAHDMGATLATLHPDCVFEDVALGRTYRGHAGAEAYYRSWWDAFGLRFARGDEGAGHFTRDGAFIAEGRFQGRHVGEFLSLAATGREVNFRFVVVVGFRDGLMAGERFFYDSATLLGQLGALPPGLER